MCKRFGVLLVCLAALVGCGHIPPEAGFPVVQDLLEGRLEQEVEWRREVAAGTAVASAVDALLEHELGPADAVQIALLGNASLQAVYERLGVAQAELVQAGRLQNPVLSASARFPSGGPGGANLEFAVVQNFLDLLMRPARKRLAASEFERTQLEVADEVLSLVAEVESSYFDVVGAQQVTEVRRLIVEAAGASYEMARRLQAAGNASALDLARERDLHATAQLEWSRAGGELAAAREALTRKMGLSGERIDWRLASSLPDLPAEEVTLEGLESSAEANRLDLAAAMKEAEMRADALGITRRWRGLAVAELGASSERDPDGSRVLGPQIAVELPIFDRRKATIARALSELRRSDQQLVALAVEIRSEVRELRDRLVLLREQAEHYREVVIPLREEIVRLTELNYNYMLAGVFELLETKKDAYDAYEEYIDTVRDYWVTRSLLRRALGGGWPESGPQSEAETGAADAAAKEAPSESAAESHEHHDEPKGSG